MKLNDVENAALLSGINNILKHIKQKKIYIHTQYTHTHTHTHTHVCVCCMKRINVLALCLSGTVSLTDERALYTYQ